MLAAETKLKNAQKVKEFLSRSRLINQDYLPVKEFGFIYFPLLKKVKVPLAEVVDTKFNFISKKYRPTAEELVWEKLDKKERHIFPKSQEIVGDILILEVPPELKKKERIIAEAYLKANPHIKTVVRKDEIHSGDYRLRKVQVLAGENKKETVHQENGVKIKLNLEGTYFSARSGSERLRVAKQVKPGEKVLVMFSGSAPYPLVIAKNSLAEAVYGIEINPLAHQYALESLALNNPQNRVKLYEGDVRIVLPRIKETFDRIVMPLPKTGEEFLDAALPKVKKGGVIHLYAFLAEEDISAYKKKVKGVCEKLGRPVRILRAVKCGQFSPRVFRVCLDMKLV